MVWDMQIDRGDDAFSWNAQSGRYFIPLAGGVGLKLLRAPVDLHVPYHRMRQAVFSKRCHAGMLRLRHSVVNAPVGTGKDLLGLMGLTMMESTECPGVTGFVRPG